MPGLIEIFPSADDLIAASAEDLGVVLLKLIQGQRAQRVNLSLFEARLWNANVPAYPHHKKDAVRAVLSEAWQWLQNEGLLMVPLDQPVGWWCLTRKGRAIRTNSDFEAYRQGNLLPVGLLHPRLNEKVRPMFMRGDYDVAVFQAFKEVEVAVRAAAKMKDSDLGRKLMQSAFNPGLMDLYSGPIGHCKNPPGHRERDFDRVSAAQLIVFASYLLVQMDRFEHHSQNASAAS